MVVQAITGLDGVTRTQQQLQAAQSAGLRLQGYVWCFPNVSVASRLSLFDGYQLESLWLDVEQPVTPEMVNRDLDLCDAWQGQLTGIYSGRWFFLQQGWSALALWSDRLLWDSNYDNVADPDAGFRQYGGWTQCAMKQFRGTSSIGSVAEIDLNSARTAP